MNKGKIKKLKEVVSNIGKKDLKKILFYGFIIVIIAVIIYLIYRVFGQNIIEPVKDMKFENTDDDQRSTMWPVLISLAVTLLGSLITTYVFLKSALDRMADEKPYYGTVIKEYRENTMKSLWRYSVFSLLLVSAVVILYVMLYFFSTRLAVRIREMIVVMYGFSMFYSAVFLRKCIDINRGIKETADKMLSEKERERNDILKKIERQVPLSDMIKKELKEESDGKDIEEWLQINDDVKKSIIDKRKFINRFSEWEKMLLLLIEKDRSFYSEQSTEERIKAVILAGKDIFGGIEDKDADANDWNASPYTKVKAYQKKLNIIGSQFCEIYAVLSEYRDLLKVQIETCEERKESIYSHIGEGREEFAKLFYVFLIYLWTNIFRMIPKITVFFPAGRFLYMNFYNTRFEDSAFRASSFKDGVFSRSKFDNSNFGMALFENCEFFSIDSRNCSFSNTLLEGGRLKEAIFKNVDFTGTVFKNCEMEKAVFNDSILCNLTIMDSEFGQNEFINSKIGNVTIKAKRTNSEINLSKCNFSESNIFDIRLNLEKDLVLPAKKEKADFIRDKYLEVLKRKDMDRYFWRCEDDTEYSDNIGLNEIEAQIEEFTLDRISFHHFLITGEENEKKEEKEKVIWKYIKNETAVNMNESGFNNTVMPEIEFYRVRMEQSILKNAQMESAKFVSVYMPGCIMNEANMREGLFWAVNMKSTVLNDAIIFKARCKLVNFEDASLRNLHASGTKIAYCTFNRSDCSGIDLTKAVLKETSFMDAILKEAEFTNAEFDQVSFENSVADHMLSSYSIFSGCRMKNAFLKQSSFNYTVFKDCNFSYANFADSAVTNVEFHRCNFKESNFRNTCFINACFEDNYCIEPEIFENCKFIKTRFKGRNRFLKQKLNIK